jgi:esterase/lipase superfamily enzyme
MPVLSHSQRKLTSTTKETSTQREYHFWHSSNLDRKMELLWFGHAGRPMIWFPTSKGRFYQAEDFGLIGAVADLIDAGALCVACVDTVDEESFYATHRHPAERLARHVQYDRYVYCEVVPWVRGRTRWGTVGTLGASLGGYHAVNFGFHHPDAVDKVVGLSAKYDIREYLDGYWDIVAHAYCPTDYIADSNAETLRTIARLDICLVGGEDDYIVGETRQMVRALEARSIPHRGHVWSSPFGHDWPSWNQQIRHYVP